MQYPIAELAAVRQVLWRDHCPGAAATDTRVLNYLLDTSIGGKSHTSGAQIARSIGEHPRTVTTSLIRLEMDDVITRGPYNARRRCRLITIPLVVEAAKRGELAQEPCIHEPGDDHCQSEAGPCDAAGHVHAGEDLPRDWAPRHWFEVFAEWGCQKEWNDLSEEAVRRWGAVMQHVHPAEISAEDLKRGIQIPRPMDQGIRFLFDWTARGPVVKSEYRRHHGGGDTPIPVPAEPPPTAPPSQWDGSMQGQASATPAIDTPLPQGRIQHHATTGSCAQPAATPLPKKKKDPTPLPPEGFELIYPDPEKTALWDEFFGELGEDFRHGQRFLDEGGWNLLIHFLRVCEPRHIERNIRDAFKLGYQSRSKGEKNGITMPLAFIASQLSWSPEGILQATPRLMQARYMTLALRAAGLKTGKVEASPKKADEEPDDEPMTPEEEAEAKAIRDRMFAKMTGMGAEKLEEVAV